MTDAERVAGRDALGMDLVALGLGSSTTKRMMPRALCARGIINPSLAPAPSP